MKKISYKGLLVAYLCTMFVFKKINDLQNYLSTQRKSEKKIGFVPTMGALHQGHISLIEKAKSENAVCVCSIFVNPTQFNNKEDLKKYPRTIEKDIEMLASARNDVLFLPDEKEIYPSTTPLRWERGLGGEAFDFGGLDKILEGKSRPGHFQGVAQVLERLLDIVRPHTLYLGQKDYQQFLIVKKMMEIFSPNIQLIMCPIIREADGLAMSSRNIRLLETERKEAVIISQTLFEMKEKSKQISLGNIKKWAVQNIQSVSSAKVDYIEIVNAENLEPIENWNEAKKIIALTAVKFGTIRLIDNVFIS